MMGKQPAVPNTPHISQYPPRETFHVEIVIFTCGKVKNVVLEICFYICKIGRSSFRVEHSTLFAPTPMVSVMVVRRAKLKLRRGLGCSVATGSAGRHQLAFSAQHSKSAGQVARIWAAQAGERERPAELCPPGHTSKPAFSATHLLSLPPSCTLYCCVRRVCTYSTSSSPPTHALSVWPLSPL